MSKPKYHGCHVFKLPSQFEIVLSQAGRDDFEVRYGKQVKQDLTYGAAAKELGECIMHALACESLIDNEPRRT